MSRYKTGARPIMIQSTDSVFNVIRLLLNGGYIVQPIPDPYSEIMLCITKIDPNGTRKYDTALIRGYTTSELPIYIAVRMIGRLPSFKRIVFQYPTSLRLFNLGWILNPLFYGIFFILLYSAREIYYSDSSVISTVVLGLICSESGLFISIFWGALSTSWTTGFYVEGICLPSPSSIVIIMTILLSALSVVVTSHYLKTLNMIGVSNYLIGTITFWIIELFCFLLISEYLGLSIYINDNAIGTYMFMLTGVHFSHVVVGGILLFFSQPLFNDTYVANGNSSTQCNQLYLVSSSNEPFNILYLHFIECLWLSIQAIIYL